MAHRCVRELFQQHIEALDGNIYANFEPQRDVSSKPDYHLNCVKINLVSSFISTKTKIYKVYIFFIKNMFINFKVFSSQMTEFLPLFRSPESLR